MKLGMITCNFYARAYGYHMPLNWDWGDMVQKHYDKFTEADFSKLMEEIKALGVDYVELLEPHASYKKLNRQDAERIKKIIESKGLKPSTYCIGGWGPQDTDIIERAYEFASGLGAKVITGCIFKPDSDKIFAKIDECGSKYDIRYAIENHPKPNYENPNDILKVLNTHSDYIGANVDTGIYFAEGYDVLKAAELLGDRIYHVHFKDAKIKPNNDSCPPSEGDVPLKELADYLKDVGYKGMISIEWEQDGDPTLGLKKSVEYCKSILK